MTSYNQNTRRTRCRWVLMSECCGITRPLIDGSLARNEDGGRRRQWRRTRLDRGVNCARPCRRRRLFFLLSHYFFSQSFAHAAEHRTSKLRRGYVRRPRLSRQHDNRKDNYGRNCNPHFMFRRGDVSGSAIMCEGPHAGDPRRARYQRRVGIGRTARRLHVKLPRLARPKGCFDTSAEWS